MRVVGRLGHCGRNECRSSLPAGRYILHEHHGQPLRKRPVFVICNHDCCQGWNLSCPRQSRTNKYGTQCHMAFIDGAIRLMEVEKGAVMGRICGC